MVWWNTSLSPPKKAKAGRVSNDDRAMALEVLAEFIVTQSVDLIGLCEMKQSDIDWLKPHCAKYGYLIENAVSKAGKGRGSFDMCVIYKAAKLGFVEQMQLTYQRLQRTSKVGIQLLFDIAGDERQLHVFLAHWPSRTRPNATVRVQLGEQLRSSVNDILNTDEKALIVIMGDFNDEPFNESLSERLMATRDRALVNREPFLLYNPFWRHLGGRDSYHHNAPVRNLAGTHFFGGDDVDRWRTFDQIIVSSAFVGNCDWHLRESSIEVVDMPRYTPQVLDPKKIFDHLPVKLVLERVTQNG